MLNEKVSYLKGLMDGLDINDGTKEGRILRVMADILEEIALAVEDVAKEVDEVVELVDIIDQDLGDVEEEIYDFEDEDGFEEDDVPDEEFSDVVTEEDFEDFDEEQMYECCCTNCGDTICISESIVKEGSMKCPNCNALLEFNYVDEDDDPKSK